MSAHIYNSVIIGAGFAGVGAAILLQQRGIDNFIVVERSDRPGGTWRDNTYPGAACDIPSQLYSYSFAPNSEWNETYSGSAEILRYIESMISDNDIQSRIRYHTSVSGLAFDETAGVWHIDVDGDDGSSELLARTVVVASGPLSTPGYPAIPGLDDFTGKKMHSAAWDHDYDFRGKKVGVIGTGASAVQIIPELVDIADSVTVFQRTPGWVLPRVNPAISERTKSVYRRLPLAQTLTRAAWFAGHESVAVGVVWKTPATRIVEAVSKLNMRLQVKDPWLRRQLTPDFAAGCKRLLMTSRYYPALQASNCKLITWPIAKICEQGVRSVEGIEHRFDALVFATGFEVANQGAPIPITGRDGRVLSDEWSSGAYAYKSIAVSGYPNLYLTFGPNSGPGHNSALVYMEAQLESIATAIELVINRDLSVLDVEAGAQRAYNTDIQRRLTRTTWNSGCQSWYLTDDGFNATMFPGFAAQYVSQMRGINFSTDFTAVQRRIDSAKPQQDKPRSIKSKTAV